MQKSIFYHFKNTENTYSSIKLIVNFIIKIPKKDD